MKRWMRFLCAIILCVLLTACDHATLEPQPSPAADAPASSAGPSVPTVVQAVYRIRTDGHEDDASYPYGIAVTSPEALAEYLEEKGAYYAFDAPAERETGLLDTLDRYDENYFADHALLLIVLSEPSSAISHEVTEITSAGCILLVRSVPEVYTDDMAQWLLFIEVNRDGSALDQPLTVEVIDRIAEPAADEQLAEYQNEQAHILLSLPAGWDYRLEEGAPLDTDETQLDQCGIVFWLEDHPSLEVSVLYHARPFGLCGTGVTFEELTLENGLTATQCTEAIGDQMSFLLLYHDTDGNYTAQCCADSGLWEQYAADVLAILGRARFEN